MTSPCEPGDVILCGTSLGVLPMQAGHRRRGRASTASAPSANVYAAR
jgi:2-keto-4-pentenoate hydratase/2-oxohepta-3-ene-1,7-dioic acid hydratase in catechol pathway